MKSKLRLRDGPTNKIVEVNPDDIERLVPKQNGTIVHLTKGTFWMVVEPDFDTLQELLDSCRKQNAMKFKDYLAAISDPNGFIPTSRFKWVIQQNPRKTAREEAIAAEVLKQANPRENITGHFPWGPEQQLVLQQLWIQPDREIVEWRDIPIEGAKDLYSTEDTEFGPMPVPNAVKEPGAVRGDLMGRVKEALGEDE